MSLSTFVCPFCPLHCDDLSPAELVDHSTQSPSKCSIRSRQLIQLQSSADARIGGDSVPIKVAQKKIEALIASEPDAKWVVGSSGLQLARRLSELTESEDAPGRIQVELSATAAAMKAAIGRCGTITATLGDVAAHADLVVFIGDVEKELPRVRERLGWDSPTSQTQLVSIETPNATLVGEVAATASSKFNIASGTNAIVSEFANSASTARYIAFLVSSNAFDPSEAEMAIELLVRMVIGINEADRPTPQRAVILSVSPSTTLTNVCSWRSQQPPSSSRSSVAPVIRLSDPIAGVGAVQVQIGGMDPGPELAEAFLPAAVPGIHQADMVIRGDGTVSLPLSKIIDTQLPTIEQWLDKLCGEEVRN